MQSIVMPEYGRIGQATRPYPPNISRLVCGDLLQLGRGRARYRSGSEGATTVWLGSRRRLRTAAGGCATGQHRVVPRVSTEVAEHAHSARREKRSSLSRHFSGKRRVCRPAFDTFLPVQDVDSGPADVLIQPQFRAQCLTNGLSKQVCLFDCR